MKNFVSMVIIYATIFGSPKVLHLTFHNGCASEIEALCKHFDYELTTWNILKMPGGFLDGKSKNKYNYTMTHERAELVYNLHKETFGTFDLIITSDIAPLSRIFLQHNFQKPLLIWVCNRFDIDAFAAGIFPDAEYLHLFQQAKHLPNVQIIGWTPYEKYHAEKNRLIDAISDTITPIGWSKSQPYPQAKPHIEKKKLCFVRDYINEKRIGLCSILKDIGVQTYSGSYAGSSDLKDFKAMIHIPCVMDNFFLYENIYNSIVHFIPTKRFYKELYHGKRIRFWDWTNSRKHCSFIPVEEIFDYCTWYSEDMKPFIVFFDSFEEIQVLLETTNYTKLKSKMETFKTTHTKKCLGKWEKVFSKLL